MELLYGLFVGAVALAFWGWWWYRAALKRETREAFTEDVKAGLWADIERSLDEREGRE